MLLSVDEIVTFWVDASKDTVVAPDPANLISSFSVTVNWSVPSELAILNPSPISTVSVLVVYEGVPNVPSCFRNSPAEPADGITPLLPVPTNVLISAAVWSWVAPASIPDNLTALSLIVAPKDEDIKAPAAATFVASVTSALLSTESSLVSWASVMNLLLEASDILAVPKVGSAPDITDWSNALTSAIDVNSESINAPAAVTLVASVTSALASIAFNLESKASVNTLESEAFPTKVLISAAVWSAVAPDSIPSNLEPSVATSLPSTFPDTVILPTTFKSSEKLNLELPWSQVNDSSAPAIVIPAPSAAAESAEPDATVIFKSSTFNVATCNSVLVPCTVKSPVTNKSANVTSEVVVSPWLRAFTAARLVTSLSINAPAAVTFVASVTSAPVSIPSNFVLSPLAKAPSEGLTCNVEIVTPLTPARSVNSESINAPAAVTLAVSVTSAPDSIPDNFTESSLIWPPSEEDINAPAAATFVASVTSAPASIAFNLAPLDAEAI